MIGYESLYSNRTKLELLIDKHERSILYLLEQHRVLIVIGETGSGKSTRIPQILYSSGSYNNHNVSNSNSKSKMVICITQPRRVAAIQLAQRVSQNLNCNLGSTVGYAVRFKDVTDSEQTLIKFMTDGLLLKEILYDPLLSKYSIIMVDEVHERSLNTDLLLGSLKCIIMKRKDLKIIICSATMNVKSMIKFFTLKNGDGQIDQVKSIEDKPPAVLCAQGKSYPVKIYYRKEPVPNYVDAAAEVAINIHESNRLASGKILIFLTGQDEVDYVHEKLDDYSRATSSRLDLKKLLVFPLYASLKPEEVSKAFESYGKNTRVCIVATNVAETSLTIDDVAFVIDCGFTKIKVYDHKTGMDSLVKVPISKSSAKQRAGRAGRTRNGSVYRLYREDDYEQLNEYAIPDIQKSSLTETVMILKSLGVSDLQRFPLISPMPEENLVAALEILYALQAIDEEGQLTRSGRIMAKLNLDPKISKILVSLESSNCTLEACRIAAMLQVKEIFDKPGRYANSLWSNQNLTKICVSEGDLISYLNILNGFIDNDMSQKWAERRNLKFQALLNATEISSKLESQLKRCGIKITTCNRHVGIIQKSIVSGLFPNAAYLHPCGDYKTVRGDEIVHVHPTSVFHEIIGRPQFVVFVEMMNTTKTYMRHIVSIEQNWLLEVAPHFYNFQPIIERR